MRLKQLKLAGFKSFVEPTVISFPSQLVAVVGPNGCGKSNIIDAVRWVMGESSAKNLRSGLMTDVIFNGASNRKPVGQASVELVFENGSGRLGGQYASYQEVAIKRVITQNGDASYFLNGSRCRRRDVSEIFLGTGVGARGYAIIGQDMIARIVEARPEDLRIYLEEAAGVSQYKERRRETLQRIKTTRENLERINDICEELAKQLARLERQAKAATRYKALKEEERRFKAEVLALKWRDLSDEKQVLQQKISQSALEYEDHQRHLASLQNQLVKYQDEMHLGNQQFQTTQHQYYQLSNEITRLEESIQQKRQEKNRIIEAIAETKADWEAASSQIEADKEIRQQSISSVELLVESLQALQTDHDAILQQLANKQSNAAQCQEQWQTVQTNKGKAHHEAEVNELKLQHLETQRQSSQARIEKINDERAIYDLNTLKDEINQLIEDKALLTKAVEKEVACHQTLLAQTAELRQSLADNEHQLSKAQRTAQQFITEHAALVAAQNAAIKAKNNVCELPQWKNHPRLVDLLTVEEKWMNACELVFGDSLQGVVVGSIAELNQALPSLENHPVVLVTNQNKTPGVSSYPRLLEKINGTLPCWVNNLADVFAADTLHDALQWLPTLSESQSVITPDGYWFGPGWVKVTPLNLDNQHRLLARKKAIGDLEAKIHHAKNEVNGFHEQSATLQDKLNNALIKADELKEILAEKQSELQRCKITLHQKEQTLNTQHSREQTLNAEIETLHHTIELLAEEKIEVQSKMDAACLQRKRLESQETSLLAKKEQAQAALVSCQHEVKTIEETLHQNQLQQSREVNKVEQLDDQIARESSRIESLSSRLEHLNTRLIALDYPESDLKRPLEQKINQYNQLEETLNQQRERIDAAKNQIDEINQVCKKEEQQVKLLQDEQQRQQLEEQAIKTRLDGVLESLTSFGHKPETLLEELAIDVTVVQHEQDLHDVSEKIKRCGAINLVAIEEYQNELQRKQHLDEQFTDLSEALVTLEQGIAKMDAETTSRLQNTFDQVNDSFQSLFPRLFGGGRAKLELTCDNLLEAGILVIAQPPGKRNSTINMLSGGEKAMTAVALVFAIFQLNPAPFCMLDEVDAPLDDANVRRFSDLVKEMSSHVQFLFVTHNKVTMELADQLIGVTMREPGVSRIVTVDIEEALSYN